MKKFADALKKRASSVASSATMLSEDEIEELQKEGKRQKRQRSDRLA